MRSWLPTLVAGRSDGIVGGVERHASDRRLGDVAHEPSRRARPNRTATHAGRRDRAQWCLACRRAQCTHQKLGQSFRECAARDVFRMGSRRGRRPILSPRRITRLCRGEAPITRTVAMMGAGRLGFRDERRRASSRLRAKERSCGSRNSVRARSGPILHVLQLRPGALDAPRDARHASGHRGSCLVYRRNRWPLGQT